MPRVESKPISECVVIERIRVPGEHIAVPDHRLSIAARVARNARACRKIRQARFVTHEQCAVAAQCWVRRWRRCNRLLFHIRGAQAPHASMTCGMEPQRWFPRHAGQIRGGDSQDMRVLTTRRLSSMSCRVVGSRQTPTASNRLQGRARSRMPLCAKRCSCGTVVAGALYAAQGQRAERIVPPAHRSAHRGFPYA